MTSQSEFDDAEVLEVQVIPSAEVRIVPEPELLSPTTTNVLFSYVIPYRCSVVPEVLEVQVIPSDEVRMVPVMHPPSRMYYFRSKYSINFLMTQKYWKSKWFRPMR